MELIRNSVVSAEGFYQRGEHSAEGFLPARRTFRWGFYQRGGHSAEGCTSEEDIPLKGFYQRGGHSAEVYASEEGIPLRGFASEEDIPMREAVMSEKIASNNTQFDLRVFFNKICKLFKVSKLRWIKICILVRLNLERRSVCKCL